ncbi:MAG: cation:proton antiporter [Reyranella sp.]|nr:cation:proton antiporter [Reyranella sp.]
MEAAAIHLPPMARFAIVMFLLLATPYAARRLHIPAVVGYILVGIVVGPHVLSVLPGNSKVGEFFAELGKLLLMFFVGLEIDMQQFRENSRKSLMFGLATFTLPMVAGTAIGLIFGYSPLSAILIGSLLASHTLIAYPIVLKAGLARTLPVTVTVGATILTDMLSLLVLAVCVTTHKSGFSTESLAIQLAELGLFIFLMVFVLGRTGRWLFKRLGQTDEASFALMLGIVGVGAALAETLHLEGILGAFLAGIAVNEAVRDTSAKEKIEFLGNVFFIPCFFIVTGFLVDVRIFASTLSSQAALVASIVFGLLASKWLAAQAVGRAWKYPAATRGLMASLTFPQVAATLATAIVGYQAVNTAGVRLLDERMLNAVLVLVVVTSVVGPVLTERYARRVADKTEAPAPAGLRPAAPPDRQGATG